MLHATKLCYDSIADLYRAVGAVFDTGLITPGDMPALSLSRDTTFHRTSFVEPAEELSLAEKSEKSEKEKAALARCVDNVVFGDVRFKSWYWSGYPKEIIGEKSLEGKGQGIMVPTLYVCKKCFGYGKDFEPWVTHCKLCTKGIPGRKIYERDAWSVWEVDGEVETVSFDFSMLLGELGLLRKPSCHAV
jgi:hypothetical protein